MAITYNLLWEIIFNRGFNTMLLLLPSFTQDWSPKNGCTFSRAMGQKMREDRERAQRREGGRESSKQLTQAASLLLNFICP